MSFGGEWIRFGTDRQHSAFCAWPERGKAPLPAVIVIQEAWGVDAHIEDVATRFAKAGYLALAPDLFAANGERPKYFSRPRMDALKSFVNTMPPSAWIDPNARQQALARLPEPERGEVAESLSELTASLADLERFVPALIDAATYLRAEHPLCRGAKVGCVGFCMGGSLSWRLACADRQLGAAVGYYGTAPAADRLARIACPVLGLYGGKDARVNATLADTAAAMSQHDKRFEPVVYDGAEHAFFNDTRPVYDARASRDAFARTLELFRREL